MKKRFVVFFFMALFIILLIAIQGRIQSGFENGELGRVTVTPVKEGEPAPPPPAQPVTEEFGAGNAPGQLQIKGEPIHLKNSGNAKPGDTKPADATDAKPADAKPTEAKPTEAKPADAKPTDAKPTDVKATDAKRESESKAEASKSK